VTAWKADNAIVFSAVAVAGQAGVTIATKFAEEVRDE
jgi:hypothetical protein